MSANTFGKKLTGGSRVPRTVQMTDKPKPREVTLVSPRYQPSKAEMEKPVEFPEGTTPDELAEAVVQPVKVSYRARPM